MVITIQSNSGISTNYYQSSSNKAESIDDTMKQINTTTLSLSYDEIQNIILTLNNIEENPFLYISIDNYYDNKKKNFTLFISEKESYKTEFKTEEILNPAYIVYKIVYYELYEKVKDEEFL